MLLVVNGTLSAQGIVTMQLANVLTVAPDTRMHVVGCNVSCLNRKTDQFYELHSNIAVQNAFGDQLASVTLNGGRKAASVKCITGHYQAITVKIIPLIHEIKLVPGSRAMFVFNIIDANDKYAF